MPKRVKNFLFYDFVKITGLIPALLFIRPKVVYVNPETKKQLHGRLLIISNHGSYLDPVMIMSSIIRRRIVFMATEDLFKPGIARWFFEHVHCIPVNKENFNMNTFRLVSRELSDDRAVAVFPEGELDEKSEGVRAFKEGAVLIALKNNAPILPVYISDKTRGRRTAVIGELIKADEIFPEESAVSKIKKCSEFLYRKELELTDFYKNNLC